MAADGYAKKALQHHMVAQNADARKPRDRWPYVGPEERRVFPSETEGG